jgi:hypothetical protein
LLLLAAVMLGLALSDIALSTHRLLAARSRVKWDWLAPLAAAVAFIKIVTQWWVWFGGDRIARGLTFEMFTGFLLSAGLLFLLAATSLPDEVGESGIDLRAYYASVSHRYWTLFALHFVAANALVLWAQTSVEGAHVSLASPLLGVLPVAVALIFIRSRWVHGAALIGVLGLYAWQEFGRSLST